MYTYTHMYTYIFTHTYRILQEYLGEAYNPDVKLHMISNCPLCI